MKTILFIAILLALTGCTDPDSSTRILKASGFKDIQITGYNFFACSRDDFYHTGFKAKSFDGQEVSGTVCSGILFKNHTVRFN